MMGFWSKLFSDEPLLGTKKNEEEYEAARSAVYRVLDGKVCILDSLRKQEQSLVELKQIGVWAQSLPPGADRSAYEYWLPYFERKVGEYIEMCHRQSRTEKALITVARPPAFRHAT